MVFVPGWTINELPAFAKTRMLAIRQEYPNINYPFHRKVFTSLKYLKPKNYGNNG